MATVVRATGTDADVERAVAAGVRALEAGDLLVHPTMGVYGLGGLAGEEIDARILGMKGRGADRPLSRIAGSVEAVRAGLPVRWDVRAERLARCFWPGPLTLVLDGGTGKGIAVRVEGHPVTARILREWGGVMSSTSLNRTGHPPATDGASVRHVLQSLGPPRGPLTILDAGSLPGPPASTIVSLRGGELRLLRAGVVPFDHVCACVREGAIP